MSLLKFGKGNAKLGKDVYTFSLPSGYTCPGANECLSRANRETGKITDGPETKFRCFSASQEGLYPNVRRNRWHNQDLLRQHKDSPYDMADLILRSLPKKAKIVRIHVAGDFFSQAYFDAWVIVARSRPDILFYAYTKSLNYWLNGTFYGQPSNLVLTASYGGKEDSLIAMYRLRYAKVVYSEEEAKSLGLEIDHDDSHAMKPGPSFALLIHGMQPKGSIAAKALSALKAKGEYGYGEKADKRRSLATV